MVCKRRQIAACKGSRFRPRRSPQSEEAVV